MTLFPAFDNSYWPYASEQDASLKQMMYDYYTQSITINQSFWAEADLDTRFRAGDQQLWSDNYGGGPGGYQKRVFNFNRINPQCNMISGYQRNHRKSTVVVPVENSDEQTASQYTKAMIWAQQRDNTDETFSSACDGAITTGMNLISVYMDYRKDPINGEICTDNISYNGFLIDPFFKKTDLSDCNFIWIRKWYSKEECKSLLPGKEAAIDNLSMTANRDGRFQYMPESYQYGILNLLTYDEFWYRSYRTQKMLVDVNTGETMEWRGSDEELKPYLAAYPDIIAIDQQIPTVSLGILVQDEVMYHGPNPMGIDRYPFVPVIGYFYPELPYFPWRIQGVVRAMRDPQYLYGRRKVIELDILESQINSGWKYKENALVNPKDVFLTEQGKGLAIKDDAQMTDVEKILAPDIPAGVIQLSQILGEELSRVSGVNEELLGSAVDDKAGILSMLRQGAGLTTLQTLFDHFDAAQKHLGRIFLELMQSNWSPGKVQRIINEVPTAQFYNKAFGKYDCEVEAGLNTPTQRQMQCAQLLEMRAAGIAIPDKMIVETSALQNKKELLDAMTQQEEMSSQIQQQELMMAFKEQEARIRDLIGKAEANTGLGIERASRVQENRALAIERIAEAEKDKEAAMLNKARALKELDGLDIEHLMHLIEIARALEGKEESEEEKLKTPKPKKKGQ